MIEKIPIPFDIFNEKLENNSKILFSGIFGSGKTTFINDFFANNKNKYESIHIYPVNYSIASNEDIFELIKYDLLFQLIGKVKKEDFIKLEIPYHLTLYNYLFSNKDLLGKMDFLASFLNFSGKYGSASLKVYEQLKHLKDNYIKFHNQFQEDDFEKVQNYLEEATIKKGHIYEEDFFTEIIRHLAFELKKETKQIVLIIDDLDRLDPGHIFRILNIFSAHIDFLRVDSDNKFDFDKVVLVCDYRNIESIFHHRYGINSDFKGYIDKFYDNIFWHNPSKIIQSTIERFIGKINIGENQKLLSHDSRVGNHIKFVLNSFLDYNLISFRDLINFGNELNFKKLDKYREGSSYRNKSLLLYFPLNAELVLFFLREFFNNDDLLLNKTKQAEFKTIKNPVDNHDDNNLDKICELILLIQHDIHDRDAIYKNNRDNFELKYDNYIFQCNVIGSDYFNSIVHRETMKGQILELNYFEVLYKAIKVYLTYIG